MCMRGSERVDAWREARRAAEIRGVENLQTSRLPGRTWIEAREVSGLRG